MAIEKVDMEKMSQRVRSLEEAAMKGRRRVPRRPINRRVGVLAKGTYSINHAYEIGEGGMLLSCETPLVEKQKIVISMRIPGVLQGVIMGTVVYVRQPDTTCNLIRYGIQFENVDFDLKRKIRNYVASSTITGSGVVPNAV